jgi:hypothetical protein
MPPLYGTVGPIREKRTVSIIIIITQAPFPNISPHIVNTRLVGLFGSHILLRSFGVAFVPPHLIKGFFKEITYTSALKSVVMSAASIVDG